ncbi:MAG: hypothetical protein WAS51_02110 [Ilumatobacteraceae bacterium]
MLVGEHPAVAGAPVLGKRDDHLVLDPQGKQLIVPGLIDRPHVRVTVHGPTAKGQRSLHLEWAALPQHGDAIGRDHFEMRKLSDGGLVADTRLSCEGVGVLRLDRSPADTQAFEHTEHEWGWHQEVAREHLGQLLALDRSIAEDMLLTVESEAVAVVEAPMSDLVRGRVALERDGALRGDEDAADALGNERPKEVVHRQERKPQAEVFTDAEHVDLLGLVDRQFVEQAACGLSGLDAPLPAASLRCHLGAY